MTARTLVRHSREGGNPYSLDRTRMPSCARVRSAAAVIGLECKRRWFPVCRSGEAVPRHVFHTALLGQELAIWRSDDGFVNAWENRCPHRGVRLTVGTNLGNVLKCRYHGWTFESGSGQCTERPAHPGEKPPALVRARTFPCVEEHGYVWTRLRGDGDDDRGPAVGLTSQALTLRSIHVRACAAMVAESLARHIEDTPEASTVGAPDPYVVHAVDPQAGRSWYFLQPVTDAETVIHATLADAPSPADRLAVLRRENDRLRAMRNAIEALASS